MPPEMQIVKDLCDFFASKFGRPMKFHFGDIIEKGEIDNDLQLAQFSRWLIPVRNDKTDTIADATEGLTQTFTASLVIAGKKASDVVEELLNTLKEIYVTSEGNAGVHDAPLEIVDASLGTLLVHRFEPHMNQIVMNATIFEGKWIVEQPVLISAEKLT